MLRFAAILGALVIVVTLGGCQRVVLAPRSSPPVAVRQPGPPAHAPAHGHRRKHQGGAELQFDSHLGLYLVLGHTDVYYQDGWFIRFRDDAWQVSVNLAGPWKLTSAAGVPRSLRGKYHAKKPGAPGRGAAKGDW